MRYIRLAATLRQHFLRLLRLILRLRTRLRSPRVRPAPLRPATQLRTTRAVLQELQEPPRLLTIRAALLVQAEALLQATTQAAQREQAEAPLRPTPPLMAQVVGQVRVQQRPTPPLMAQAVGQAKVLQRHSPPLMAQVVGQVRALPKPQRMGLAVELLAVQPKLLAGQLTGHLRPVSLHREATTPRTKPTGGTIRDLVVTYLDGATCRLLMVPLVRHRRSLVGLTTEVP